MTPSARRGARRGTAPQWSPLLGSGMTPGSLAPTLAEVYTPQWSPLLGSGMTLARSPHQAARTSAAMEPAPWERDDPLNDPHTLMMIAPQWSPLLGSGMTPSCRHGLSPSRMPPQWSPLLGSGMT